MKSPIRLLICACIVALSFTGCVTAPSPQDDQATLQRFGYGGPIPVDWQDQAKAFVLENLKDPESARFKFNDVPPRQSWVREAPLFGRRFASGWLVSFEVNAKNSYGGYVGFKPYAFIFRDGKIIAYQIAETGRYGENLVWIFLPGCPVY
jgi:hypothetical protein